MKPEPAPSSQSPQSVQTNARGEEESRALRALKSWGGNGLHKTREAQQRWAATSIRDRLRIVRRLRARIAEEAMLLAGASGASRSRPAAETLTAEVLPLADACRFLERNAERLLQTRRLGRHGLPLWLAGLEVEVRREALGVVLVIAAANYPLFLPAVQTIQALVAGNAVLIKPGVNGSPAAVLFCKLLRESGLDPDLLQVLEESPEAARDSWRAGVDKVVLTGSALTGVSVLSEIAPQLIPATMELSGSDPVIIRADADLELTVRALEFGRRLNNGDTCIAPRRIYAVEPVAAALADRLSDTLSVVSVDDDAAALHLANSSPFALGASIFSRDAEAARRLARRVRAGVVFINEMIAPSADPRVCFGGRGRSGFGVTRGPEGLLEMTAPKVITGRAGTWRPHFDSPAPGDEELFNAYIAAVHGRGFRSRLTALARLLRGLEKKAKS